MDDELHAAYQEDRCRAPAGPDEEERLRLADDLGCHEGARAEAWEAWRAVLELEALDLGESGDLQEETALTRPLQVAGLAGRSLVYGALAFLQPALATPLGPRTTVPPPRICLERCRSCGSPGPHHSDASDLPFNATPACSKWSGERRRRRVGQW